MTLFRRLAAVLALCAIVLTAAPTVAQATGSGSTYVVEPGDYLLGIASEHDVSLSALLRANDLTVYSLIMPGQELTIPGSSSGSASGGSSPAASSPEPAGSAAPGSTYTVVAGDALSTIAARHGVSLTSLLQANDLTVTSLILPGRRLSIPAGASAPAAASTPAAPAPSADDPQSGGDGLTYTVVPGDALSLIASRHGVSLASLLRANDLTVSSMIFPGRQLVIPAGGTAPSAPAGTASDAGADPAPAASSSQAQRVVDYALAQVGKPYKFFTKGPETFDCSGLTLAAYEQVGISLIHFSAAQALQGEPVDFASEPIKPGDLVFLSRNDSGAINHVGIAVSATKWVHATGPGDTVRTGWMPSKSSIVEVRRFVNG